MGQEGASIEVCATCKQNDGIGCEIDGPHDGRDHPCPSYKGVEKLGPTYCPQCGTSGEWVEAKPEHINQLYAEAWGLPDPTPNAADILEDIFQKMTSPHIATRLEYICLVGEAAMKFEEHWPAIRGDMQHVLVIPDNIGWTLNHPLRCRIAGLEHCKATKDVAQFFDTREPVPGQWKLADGKDGGVVIPGEVGL